MSLKDTEGDNLKGFPLYNSTFMTMSKRQNYLGWQGLGWGEGMTVRECHEGVFWSDRIILYPDYGSSYRSLSRCYIS
jgi:hypothetical protein